VKGSSWYNQGLQNLPSVGYGIVTPHMLLRMIWIGDVKRAAIWILGVMDAIS
jgi:hypothetical protein